MKKNKYFIITIDTEADNQWDFSNKCTTENAKYLPRFQELAEKYGYKPVWLTTYEMAKNDSFVKYFKKKQNKNLCEIGMHLHAWNNPPEYKLEHKVDERSYLIEYPIEVMKKKIENLDKLLTDKFGIKPVSHRAGRWAMNSDYFHLLSEFGYKIDCSVTPYIDWKKSIGETGIPGSNYKKYKSTEFFTNENILEVPMTIRKIRIFEKRKITNIKRLIREMQWLLIGKKQWIRPDCSFSFSGIKKAINICNKNSDYIMFMIHSSELMPGGSPNFKDEESVEKLYNIIERIFQYAKELGYKGITLRNYLNLKRGID